MDRLDESLKSCLQKLEAEDFRGATNELYPVNKSCQTQLTKASAPEVEKFVKQMTRVLGVFNIKLQKLRLQQENSTEDHNLNPTAGTQTSQVKDDARFMMMDTFRILRTSCYIQKVQESYGWLSGQQMMKDTKEIMFSAINIYSSEQLTQSMSVAIQFLANLANNCPPNQDLVWDHFNDVFESWIEETLKAEVSEREKWIKVTNLVCAVIDNCLPRQWERVGNFLDIPINLDLVQSIIRANTAHTAMDFGKKAVKKLVQIPGLFKKVMKTLEIRSQFMLLHFLDDVINEWRSCDEHEGDPPTINSNLVYLVNHLVLNQHLLNADKLCCIATQEDRLSLAMLVRIVEILSVASCCRSCVLDISTVKVGEEGISLLVFVIKLLLEISERGRQSYNDLSVIRREDFAVDTFHPAYLLRRDLIRIIGNLAYENKENQDTIRTACNNVGIPLLLEHTNLDKRNPFIQEWAKLALCNVVNGNEENCNFVSKLKLRGTVDPTGILRDCGLTVEVARDDRLVVGPSPSMLTLSKLAEKAPKRP